MRIFHHETYYLTQRSHGSMEQFSCSPITKKLIRSAKHLGCTEICHTYHQDGAEHKKALRHAKNDFLTAISHLWSKLTITLKLTP